MTHANHVLPEPNRAPYNWLICWKKIPKCSVYSDIKERFVFLWESCKVQTQICHIMTAEILCEPITPVSTQQMTKINFYWFPKFTKNIHDTMQLTHFVQIYQMKCHLESTNLKHIPPSVKTKQRHCIVAYRNVTMVISVTSFAIIFLLPLCFHRGPNLI